MPRPRNAELGDLLSPTGDILAAEKPKRIAKEKEVGGPETYTYELVGEYPSVDGVVRYPASFSIPNEDTIYDPETGRQRTIRYLVGVDTIWMDEQSDLDKHTIKRLTPKTLHLANGKLIVDAHDEALVEFLTLSNRNEATTNRKQGTYPMYRLVDNQKKEMARLQFLKDSRKAAALAEDAEEEDMLAQASYVGISKYNDQGALKSMEGLRADYIKYASERPDMFNKTYKNPLAVAFVKVREAIEKGIITVTYVRGQAHWNDTKAIIANIPEGKSEYDFLAGFSLTPEGKSFKERLSELL